MKNNEVVAEVEGFVRKTLQGAEGGHDWWHIERVRNLALAIGTSEGADVFIVELAALLHDIADSKFNNGDEEMGPSIAQEQLVSLAVDNNTIQQVVDIIRGISFKGGHNQVKFPSLELQVVQDADRLDAMGAIGIARAFNYGGFKGRELYSPDIKPNLTMTKEEYKKSDAPTINHFYEKLLLLKDLMNTKTGREMAAKRHEFMEGFLMEFYAEWQGSN